jgi:tetratricopeptide (TPR) repeat protein
MSWPAESSGTEYSVQIMPKKHLPALNRMHTRPARDPKHQPERAIVLFSFETRRKTSCPVLSESGIVCGRRPQIEIELASRRMLGPEPSRLDSVHRNRDGAIRGLMLLRMTLPLRPRFLLWLGLSLGVVLGLALLTAIAASKFQARRFRTELEQARQRMATGRLSLARKSLADLAERWPRNGEVLVLLGQCEEALGRPDRALAAWALVPPRDSNFVRAADSQGSLLIDLGRYAPAESLLLNALATAPDAGRYPLLRTIARLFRLEGRYVEVSDVLVAAWGRAPDPGAVLQELWQNDTEPVPVDAWKRLLDAAARNDDRVWLGQARHAVLTGRFGDAEKWLGSCMDRRPDDPTVWRACLDLAVATDDGPRFWKAVERISAEGLPPWEIAARRSWLAAQSGDPRAELRELTRSVELRPDHSRALERLAVLAQESGDLKEAQRLRRRKAEIDRAKDDVHKLIVRKIDLRSHARDLARISAVLGRQFDEQAWSLVAATSSALPQPSPGTSSTGPPGADPNVEQSRTFCRAVSDTALERLLAKQGEQRTPTGKALLDRLADLRGASVRGKDPMTTTREPAMSTAPRLHFVDDAEVAELRFIFDNGKTPICLLPETVSGGVGLIDFDGDGWLDVYCVQGGALAATDAPAGASAPRNRDTKPGDSLFRNQRDGTFRDVTRQTGIDRLAWGRGYGMGVTVGDYDNDGHPDLFITRVHRYDLFRNRGDGTFEDVTERAGLAGLRDNPTSAAFADLDGDGDLDLYVCHYVRFDPDHPPLCKNERGEYYYCDPAKLERAADHVFRNDRGQFVDVTEAAGFTDPDGRGLGVVAADLDDDNRIDLYVANDGTANFLFHNLGGFRFEEIGLTSGVACSAEGGFQAGMGVASADLDGDGRLDLLVTNLYLEGTTLYHNLGNGMFADRSAASGILSATRYLLGFGIAVFDAANDGRLDVAIANGNVNDFRPYYPFAMPSRLYEGRPGGRLVDVSDSSGLPWAVPRLGRGLAAGDLDNDGRIDLLVVAQNQPLAYFHNQTQPVLHFVTFRLEGTQSNRDGVGARVVIATRSGRQVAERVGGGSYLSACDGRLHFGLGASTSIESVEVRWPSGRRDRWKSIAADAGYLLKEGDPVPRPLAPIR